MMLGIGKEAVIFLYAGLSGIVTFSCYQILLLLRKLIAHSAAAVSIEDFFYWIGISVYLFRQMYHTTYGSVRWFFILGIVVGNFLAFFCKILLTDYSSQFFTVLGKGITSRMFPMPVRYITHLSKPSPKPA